MTSAIQSGDLISERLMRTLEIFDIEKLKTDQETLIHASLAGKDILGILPTGYGKSACYQIPGVVLGERTLVISPLISLQEDQVQALRRRGIHAFALHSNLDDLKRTAIRLYFREPRPGVPSFLYVSPETLLSRDFANLVRDVVFHRVAIDEAHCVSTWGNGFRPDYQRLDEAIRRLKIPHRSAFTATADAQIERDILRRIPLREGFVRVDADPMRPNLLLKLEPAAQGVSYKTKTGKSKLRRLHHLLTMPDFSGPAIVYCRTKNWSAALYEIMRKSSWFHEAGYTPYLFHSGLLYEDKQMALSGFINDEKPVVFATSAFGLGIDRADIRQIIHYSMPFTLVDYAQQIGRGGRDGLPTLCTAFHAKEEYLERQLKRVSSELPTYDFVERALRGLSRALQSMSPEKRRAYSTRAYLMRMRAMVDASSEIKAKGRYLRRLTTSLALLQRVGLIAVGPSGLEVHPIIPGTPPHKELLEATRMHERMMVREQERMAQFFAARELDQALLWEIIRTE